MAGAGDAFNKLRKTVEDNADKAEGLVGKAADAAKKATGGAHDDKIDKASGAATDYLRKQGDGEGRTEEGSGDSKDRGQGRPDEDGRRR
ncbi:Rv0909 family putative TA system antitoxin [Nocardiopsis listeri]|uniref:Rv0909 family putative TA system antitoxin n=1 Tax=Nocardiopsis listeri TaxID=53440 RepID=UPI00082F3ED2|nr:Rv0909 family putative TA system antitoxin [Nocardiopsis listeri]